MNTGWDQVEGQPPLDPELDLDFEDPRPRVDGRRSKRAVDAENMSALLDMVVQGRAWGAALAADPSVGPTGKILGSLLWDLAETWGKGNHIRTTYDTLAGLICWTKGADRKVINPDRRYIKDAVSELVAAGFIVTEGRDTSTTNRKTWTLRCERVSIANPLTRPEHYNTWTTVQLRAAGIDPREPRPHPVLDKSSRSAPDVLDESSSSDQISRRIVPPVKGTLAVGDSNPGTDPLAAAPPAASPSAELVVEEPPPVGPAIEASAGATNKTAQDEGGRILSLPPAMPDDWAALDSPTAIVAFLIADGRLDRSEYRPDRGREAHDGITSYLAEEDSVMTAQPAVLFVAAIWASQTKFANANHSTNYMRRAARKYLTDDVWDVILDEDATPSVVVGVALQLLQQSEASRAKVRATPFLSEEMLESLLDAGATDEPDGPRLRVV